MPWKSSKFKLNSKLAITFFAQFNRTRKTIACYCKENRILSVILLLLIAFFKLYVSCVIHANFAILLEDASCNFMPITLCDKKIDPSKKKISLFCLTLHMKNVWRNRCQFEELNVGILATNLLCALSD